MTVTGKTLGENLADVVIPEDSGGFLCDPSAPLNAAADLQICFGNLAPGGVVFKVSSLPEPRFAGRALVFEEAKAVADAAAAGTNRAGDGRGAAGARPGGGGDAGGVGRQRGPCRRRSWTGRWPSSPDTRVSGVSHGAIGVHCCPEAAVGGPDRTGGRRRRDSPSTLEAGTVEWRVTEEETVRRRSAHVPKPVVHDRRYLAEFAATVAGADRGCVGKALRFESEEDRMTGPFVVNLGGEGEEPGALNQQPARFWFRGRPLSRDGSRTLGEEVDAGAAFLLCPNDPVSLPDGCADVVLTNGVPIYPSNQTAPANLLGTAVLFTEVERLLKPGGRWFHDKVEVRRTPGVAPKLPNP